jgi:tRNA/tmRNA/rRNA uracil-C5-methylase (TrmA/RlmC/RlmD family)
LFERGQTLKGVAERLGMNAEGVMRQAGKVLFVPGLLPGEEAEVRVESSRNRYATGSLVHLLHASADRVSPPCAHYADCGGCSCQHMRYEAQLAFKRGQVSDVLRRVGGLDVRVEETIGAASPWRYRNKTRFQIDWTGGVPRIGFFARGSRRLAAVDDCLISHPDACRSAGVFQRWMRQDGQINTKLMPTSLTVQVSSLGHVSVLAATVALLRRPGAKSRRSGWKRKRRNPDPVRQGAFPGRNGRIEPDPVPRLLPAGQP